MVTRHRPQGDVLVDVLGSYTHATPAVTGDLFGRAKPPSGRVWQRFIGRQHRHLDAVMFQRFEQSVGQPKIIGPHEDPQHNVNLERSRSNLSVRCPANVENPTT